MPSPKSGKAGSAIEPAEPKAPEEADKANPGEVEQVKAQQRQTQTGKYASVQVKPHKPPEDDEEKKSWIEIELLDEEDKPVPGERYRITLPDGKTVAEGTLDENGFARVEGIDSGQAKIEFPDLDESCWNEA
jgi:hypothetical protein